MKQVKLEATTRTEFGTAATRRVRSMGQIPAVLYGEHGVQHLSLKAPAFSMAWRQIAGKAALLAVHVDGAEEPVFAFLQEFQRDAQRDDFLHLDFKEIVRGKEMEAEIPVDPQGKADGVRNFGGVLEINADTLNVRCRPRNLPEAITFDVTHLQIGKSIHLSEITPPEGVEFLDDPELVVVSCVGSASGASAAADAAAEPVTAEA